MTRRLLVLVLLAAPLPALGQPLIRDQGVSLGRPWEIDFTGAGITCTAPSFTKVSCDVTSGGGGGAPTGALYLVGAADATLSAEIVVSPLTDDIVMVANGSTWQTKVLPDCDLVTQKITYDTATNAFACSSSITASDLSCTTCLTVGSEVSTTAERDSFFRVRASDTTSGDTLHDSPRLGMTGEYWASTVSVPHTWEAWNDMTGSATGTLTFTWGGTNHVTTINQAGAVTAGDFVCSAGNCIGSADVAGLDVGDITTGTLGQARGGTGVGALTCTSGQALVSNGTSYSCTSTITASDLVAGSGVVADSELASNYSGIGTCGSNTWASTLNDAAAPTCTQPAFSNLSGTVAISQGGTTETASTEDAVLVGSGTTDWQPRTVPSCSNATTSKLLYDNSTNTFSCGTDQTSAGGSVICEKLLMYDPCPGAGAAVACSTAGRGSDWAANQVTNIGASTIRSAEKHVSMDRYTHVRLVWAGWNSASQTGTVTVLLRVNEAGSVTTVITSTFNTTTSADRTTAWTDISAYTGQSSWHITIGSSAVSDDPYVSAIYAEFCNGTY
jgi:hypothetical protein